MITKRRQLLSLVTVIALFACALGQRPGSTEPSIDRLRQVITYLASDSLEGRRTGTPGANDAAHYIAGEFNRFGLRPGMQVGRAARTRGENQSRYLQPFPYISGVELGKNNSFSAKPERPDDTMRFRVGEDWMPLGFSSDGQVENIAAVFVGYGITASDLNYDEYAVIDVSGKVVVTFEGTPDGDNPHGQFSRFEDVRFKAVAARDHGAKALLIIAREEKLNEDRLAHLRYDNAASDAGLPVAVISRQTALRLFHFDNAAALNDLESKVRTWPPGSRTENIRGYGVSATTQYEFLKDISLALSINVVRRESPSFNVIGVLPGGDPRLKEEAIVIGAHYDHLGRGGQGSLAQREGDIHHGADDNASGVAGLMELARMFSSQNPKPRRTIVFIAFSGEEEGLIGSSYYVNHPVAPLANTVAMINLDMIGRMNERRLIIGGVGTATEWRPFIDASNSTGTVVTSVKVAGMPVPTTSNGKPTGTTDPGKKFDLTTNEDGFGPSDHSSFYGKQIPVLFFWTGTHNDYHKPSDTAEKINYEGEARIVSFVASIVRDVDKSDQRPSYTVARVAATARSTGFRVYLGTIPNYADSNDGLLLDGVRDDSPAARAGLKAGDRIVRLAGREVKNVYDYTYALGEMKAGQEYEVELMRGSERLTFKITPEKRP